MTNTSNSPRPTTRLAWKLGDDVSTDVAFGVAPLPGGGAVRTYTDVTAWRQAEAELRGAMAEKQLIVVRQKDVESAEATINRSQAQKQQAAMRRAEILALDIADAVREELRARGATI